MIENVLEKVLEKLGSLDELQNVNSTITIILKIVEKNPSRIVELLPILKNQNKFLGDWIKEHQLHEDIEEDVFGV